MPSVFPDGIDNFVNPTPANNLNDALVLHSDEHTNANDAINAIERWVGVSGSLVAASHEYRIKQLELIPPGQSAPLNVWDNGVPIGSGTIINFHTPFSWPSVSGTVIDLIISGTPGPQGIQGPVGPSGSPGIQGPIGPSGSPGIQGPIGPSGSQGPQGIPGPSGSPGSQGIQGPIGPMGMGTVAWDEGIVLGTGTVFNFVGAPVYASISGSVVMVTVTGTPAYGPAGGDLSGTYPNPIVLKASKSFNLTGILSATVSGTYNPYNPVGLENASVLLLTSNADTELVKLGGGTSGRIMAISVVGGTGTVTLYGADGGGNFSSSRFMKSGHGVIVAFDDFALQWRTLSALETHDHTSQVMGGPVSVEDASVLFFDRINGNVSTAKHGFVPKLPGITNYVLNGTGTWVGIGMVLDSTQDGGSIADADNMLFANPGGGEYKMSWATVKSTLQTAFNPAYINPYLKSVTVYDFVSSGTYTLPAGITTILVEMVGGGGGSGGAQGTAANSAAGAGGGAGAYLRKLITAPSGTYSYFVGTRGAAGAGATATAGGDGGDTIFGTLVAPGGGGGAGMAAGTAATGVDGGSGGTLPTTGDVNIAGSAGFPGIRLGAAAAISGGGAGSYFGGAAKSRSIAANSVAASVGGSGASGGATNNATDRNGALGGPGLIIVYEYGN